MKAMREWADAVRFATISGVLLGWCAALLVFRWQWYDSTSFSFLPWNLFLAAIPAAAAYATAWLSARHAPVWLLAAGFATWLAFLPNAPYIVTDFFHLHPRPPVPVWYDIALLASCAGTGVLLGYVSLALVQGVVARRLSAAAGWLVVLAAAFLSGFGIYLGRFQRWNSWDVLTQPAALFLEIARHVVHPFSHPRTFAVTLLYGGALLVGYAAFRLLPAQLAMLERGAAPGAK